MSEEFSTQLTPSLFDRRLIVVTGKGGVGRSTVATAIALAAGKRGKRAAIAEMYGNHRVPPWFGYPQRAYESRPIAPLVDTFSMTPLELLDDFGHRKLKLDALVRLLFHSRVTQAFLDAVPGLHDLFHLGKLENLLHEPLAHDPRYDLIVLDAPATGHGLTLLAAARTMTELARVGPFYDLAALIEGLIADPLQTAVVLVTLPEELPVNETLEFAEALGADQPLLHQVVVNQVRTPYLPETPPWEHVEALLGASSHPDLHELLRVAEPFHRRQSAQQAALQRLTRLDALMGRFIPKATLPKIEANELLQSDLIAFGQALAGVS